MTNSTNVPRRGSGAHAHAAAASGTLQSSPSPAGTSCASGAFTNTERYMAEPVEIVEGVRFYSVWDRNHLLVDNVHGAHIERLMSALNRNAALEASHDELVEAATDALRVFKALKALERDSGALVQFSRDGIGAHGINTLHTALANAARFGGAS